MIKHTDEILEQNYNNFITALSVAFSGKRLSLLQHMYSMEELGPNLIISPASSNIGFHSAYVGGYIEHVMNVVKNSIKVMKLFESVGGIIKFTQDELLFSAFHHDLGKLGDKNKISFIPNPSDWHIKNQGKIYTRNPELSWLNATDRTFLLLSQYGIQMTENEYYGIKLTDGLYDEDNKKYLVVYDNDKKSPSHIGTILHWADHMSSIIERDSQ